MQLNASQIARVCHEAHRLYCEDADLPSQMPWGHAPEYQRASTIKGVEAIMAAPWMGPADAHASWWKEKVDTGWKYGPVKDAVAKTHPCMVPYHELPEAQRTKDLLFVNIVRALMPSSVWDREMEKPFDPAAPIDVGTGEANSNVDQTGETNGQVAEGQPAGETTETDRDGRKPASEEGGGKTDTAEVGNANQQFGDAAQSYLNDQLVIAKSDQTKLL